jgi:hypothetical protein
MTRPRCTGNMGNRGIACCLALCGVMGPHPRDAWPERTGPFHENR